MKLCEEETRVKTVELDLTGCTCLFDIHERIRVAFEFPEWYGANWDAFWDLLWSECEADEVVIKGEDSLPDELQHKIINGMFVEDEKTLYYFLESYSS